jgi:osmotically-inducible protein OsmY
MAPERDHGWAMTQSIHFTDQELRTFVTDELQYDPSVEAQRISVVAESGTVTLSGETTSLAEKHNVKRSTMRVRGVSSIVDKMTVRDPGSTGATDADLAEVAAKMLDWTADVPTKSVKATVQNHVITLSGNVAWDYQREAATRAVENLRGITEIKNTMMIDQPTSKSPAMNLVAAALKRSSLADSNAIHVDVKDHELLLNGNVGSFAEYRQAERIAWASPGVTKVTNNLRIGS